MHIYDMRAKKLSEREKYKERGGWKRVGNKEERLKKRFCEFERRDTEREGSRYKKMATS